MSKLLVLLLIAFTLGTTRAGEAQPMAQDPQVEQRLVVISEELRCLVCQNESLSGSQADLAQDLRREIRTLIKAGKTDAEIRDFLVARYGDFVLYRPPVKPVTWLLWFGPFVLLLVGAVVLARRIRQGRRQAAAAPIDAAQREKLQNLMQQGDKP